MDFLCRTFTCGAFLKTCQCCRVSFIQQKDIPDIIAITETKLTENSVSNICIPGYVFLNANSKTFAGGVGLELLADGVESCWIEIPRKRQKNVVIGSIYRHPFNDRAQFLDILKDKMI